MNATELATKLNGMKYPLRIPLELLKEAKESGLLVVYGESDDLMEFDGAFRDEADVYDGGTVMVYKEGILGDRDERDTDDQLKQWLDNKSASKPIEAVWDNGEYSWSYETDISHETFDILKDNEKYCRGLVISIADI